MPQLTPIQAENNIECHHSNLSFHSRKEFLSSRKSKLTNFITTSTRKELVCRLLLFTSNMNFHLKRHRKLSEVLHVPEGLEELMSDIAREVLRFQPLNVEAFIADYLEAMVLTREIYFVAERTVDDILSQSMHFEEMMRKTGVSAYKTKEAISLVMESFR